MSKKKVYVGCALTHATEAQKERIETFKSRLARELGVEVLQFLGTKIGTARDVYIQDIHKCVGTCDVFVAFCDYPSTGLGYELAVAVEVRKIPTLAVAHHDSKVTRLVEGIPEEMCIFARYTEIDEVVVMVRGILQNLS